MTLTLDLVRAYMFGFGLALRLERENRKLTLRTLANRLGIDHVQLSRIERGQWIPSEDETARIREWMSM